MALVQEEQGLFRDPMWDLQLNASVRRLVSSHLQLRGSQ